jgi:general secretion pathway protein G
MHQPNNGQQTTDNGPRSGFTLIELLVVIIILALLVALLLPAINGAMRTARNAAVQAEINQLAQALEAFKSKYGDYPPSRIYLSENGDFSGGGGVVGSNSPVSDYPGYTGVSSSQPDITVGQLAARSAAILRKFFPRLVLRTDGFPVFSTSSPIFYDFNGDGVMGTLTPTGVPDPAPYILQGHECLVFFLGGVPLPATPGNPTSTFSVTGFGKDPTNPFTNSLNIAGNPMYNANRQPPFFEFNAGRLFLDPTRIDPDQQRLSGYRQCNMPGYVDSLTGTAPIPGTSVNFYAYFSAYGNGNYDPNDVNFPETDPSGGVSPAIGLQYIVGFPVWAGQLNPTQAPLDQSPAPNPYTTTLTANNPPGALPSGTVGYQKPQSYQIISPGADGLYGVGGQYQPPASSASVSLPVDSANLVNTNDTNVRTSEYDNLTNFKSGTLH